MISGLQYLAWKEEELCIKYTAFILLLGLPIALWKMFYGFYGAFCGHRATTLRHVGDVGQFCTLLTILSTVFFTLHPVLEYVTICTLDPTEDCHERAISMRGTILFLIFLNTLMMIWDFVRYFGNQQDDMHSEMLRGSQKRH
jgi:hypothetical protein